MRRLALALVVAGSAVLVLLAGSAYRIWSRAPAAVPDHATVFSATTPMLFAGTTTLAQRLTPRRDGLTAVDVVLAAEEAQLPGMVQMEVLSWPGRERLRQSQLPAASLPQGSVWNVRPGQPGERWSTFGFEPLPETAGRELLVVLSYPSGTDRPGSRLATLAHLPGTYPQAAILVNGTESRGNLLFRLSAAGRRGEALASGLQNLRAAQPVLTGTLTFPAVGAATCLILAAALLRTLLQGHPSEPSRPVTHPDALR